jgi:hypothetical protein
MESPAFYPADEWVDDLSCLFELGRTHDTRDHSRVFRDHMFLRYADDPRGEEKMMRLFSAYNYLVRHRMALDEGSSAVFGRECGIVRIPLIEALYRLFVSIPLDRIEDDVPVEVLKRLIREQESLD